MRLEPRMNSLKFKWINLLRIPESPYLYSTTSECNFKDVTTSRTMNDVNILVHAKTWSWDCELPFLTVVGWGRFSKFIWFQIWLCFWMWIVKKNEKSQNLIFYYTFDPKNTPNSPHNHKNPKYWQWNVSSTYLNFNLDTQISLHGFLPEAKPIGLVSVMCVLACVCVCQLAPGGICWASYGFLSVILGNWPYIRYL